NSGKHNRSFGFCEQLDIAAYRLVVQSYSTGINCIYSGRTPVNIRHGRNQLGTTDFRMEDSSNNAAYQRTKGE
ncbi:MAG: hypothetical protein L6Q97_20930, partial [Thermoanaerobaculia bacterium]|nr:hypothetical protein [Thermoanaerobaculia bacterium]